jgi:L-iditol 2-dehydrogenase
MKAVVFLDPGRIELQTYPIPSISPDEMLVRVKAAAICGTDVRIYKGLKTRGVRTPSTLGHEFSGEVAEVGAKVEAFRVGDAVAISPLIPCGNCDACRRGMENVCIQRAAFGYEYDGAFAEYIKIPASSIRAGGVIKLEHSVPFIEACLAEPLSCCIHGLKRMSFKQDESLLVLGVGPIGLMHVKLASRAGSPLIVVSDPIEERRNQALASGAHLALDPDEEELVESILNATAGIGIDKVVHAVSKVQLIGQVLSALRRGGAVNLFSGSGMAEIDANQIHYRELSLIGSSAAEIGDFSQAVELISTRAVDVRDMITDVYPLDEFETALAGAVSMTGLKTVLTP